MYRCSGYIAVFLDILSLPDRIRQMPAELLRFPARALKVKVAGFKAPSVNREKDVLPYSPAWSVKAAREMIELLHSSITASVVVRTTQHVFKMKKKINVCFTVI